MASPRNTLLIKYGELFLKSPPIRKMFIKRLLENIKAALNSKLIPFNILLIRHDRIIMEADEKALEYLSKIPGIASIAYACETEADYQAMLQCILESLKPAAGSIYVRAKRVTKTFPLKSVELSQKLSHDIASKLNMEVRPKNPEVTVYVEILGGKAYIYTRKIDGVGGLPVGTAGRAVALVSGGIDSPVALWLMIKRGLTATPIYMLRSQEELAKVRKIVSKLQEYVYPSKLNLKIVEWADYMLNVQGKLKAIGKESWICIFCKRYMLKQSEKIALSVNANAIITGESIGQVASQTLPNMRVISKGIKLPILRPLIGFDKSEIVQLAQKIGTYQISIEHILRCPFMPKHPVTRASWGHYEKIAMKAGLQP